MDILQGFKNLASLFTKGSTNNGVFGFVAPTSMPAMNEREFLKAYRGWVYACTDKIANRMADIELLFQKKNKDGDWETVNEGHQAMQLLYDVNDFMSFGELMYNYSAFQDLDGNTFWYLPRSVNDNQNNPKKPPLEIWPLDPSRMRVVKSEANFIAGYVYTNESGIDIPFDIPYILHFKRFNSKNMYRGMGTVEAAAIAIDTDTASAEWQRNFFSNAAMPAALLSAQGTLNQDQYKRIK